MSLVTWKCFARHATKRSTCTGTPQDNSQNQLRHSPTLLATRDNTKLVYGLGQAALAKNLGYRIDEPAYKRAGFLLRGWGYVPWDMPPLSTALARCANAEDAEIIRYYYSEEAAAAIAQAAAIKQRYFDQFPAIQQFLKDATQAAKRRGWIKTWTGRRRHFKKPKEEAYKAPNALIQGGCGDIIKQKMSVLTEMLAPYKSGIINNIHDALLFEIAEDELHLIKEIKAEMERLPFSVPLTCSIEVSKASWAEMEKYSEENN